MALVGFILLTGTYAFASTDGSSDLLSEVKVFDGNGNQIPYTTEELKQHVRFEAAVKNLNPIMDTPITTLANYRTYSYGPMNFSNNFYIGPGYNGMAFLNPFDTLITVNGTAKKIKVNAFNDTGTGSGKLARSIELPGGWRGTVHISSWSNLPSGKYRFRIDNLDRESFTINNITVWFDPLIM